MNQKEYARYEPWRRDPMKASEQKFGYAGWNMIAILDAKGNLLHVVPDGNHSQLKDRHVRDAGDYYRDSLRSD